MIDLLERCFPDRLEAWKPTLLAMVPSYGRAISDDPALAENVLESTAATLAIAS
jgi:malate dehydrogenase (quinone)